MDKVLERSVLCSGGCLHLGGSKSETARALVLQALLPSLVLENASGSDDSVAMVKGLACKGQEVDIGYAGTAMRFLTAYFACRQGREVLLTGSGRMKERPIDVLVSALRSLGADISYVEREGFPPLYIKGVAVRGGEVRMEGGVSSQYASALLLIAPFLPEGLKLTLEGRVTSRPYLEMTVSLLQEVFGKRIASWKGNCIEVFPQEGELRGKGALRIESDWSSASYWYSFVALSDLGTELCLKYFKGDSYQGDRALVELYELLGVHTVFEGDGIRLRRVSAPRLEVLDLDLNATPDIAQTVAVTCLGLGIGCELWGLHTLKIKETDRLLALQTEMRKMGAKVEVSDDSLRLEAGAKLKSGVRIATYDDHRMAMAFTPLMLKVRLIIENSGVVSKSYPDFWEDVSKNVQLAE